METPAEVFYQFLRPPEINGMVEALFVGGSVISLQIETVLSETLTLV